MINIPNRRDHVLDTKKEMDDIRLSLLFIFSYFFDLPSFQELSTNV